MGPVGPDKAPVVGPDKAVFMFGVCACCRNASGSRAQGQSTNAGLGSERPVMPGGGGGAVPINTPAAAGSAHPPQGAPHPSQMSQSMPNAHSNPHNQAPHHPHSQPPHPHNQGPHAPPMHPAMAARTASKDEEDTMRNLRKTFAGIFGDM